MKDTSRPSLEAQAIVMKYCDRCARRSSALFYDDLTLQDLCQECCDRLAHRRVTVTRPVQPMR